MTFVVGKSTQMLLLMALSVQWGNSLMSKTFHRVTVGGFNANDQGANGVQLSNVQSAVACAAFCGTTGICQDFVWDPDSMTCSVGLGGSTPGVHHIYNKAPPCGSGYQTELMGTTPLCLVYVQMKMNKPEAEAECASRQGHLARPFTQAKLDLMRNIAIDANPTYFWLLFDGGDDAVEGTFVWSDGSPFDSTTMSLFGNGEGDDGPTQNYVVGNINFNYIVDGGNGYKHYFFCEKAID